MVLLTAVYAHNLSGRPDPCINCGEGGGGGGGVMILFHALSTKCMCHRYLKQQIKPKIHEFALIDDTSRINPLLPCCTRAGLSHFAN